MSQSKSLVQKAKDEVFKGREEVEIIVAVEVKQCALTAALLNKNKKTARQALGEPRIIVVSGEHDKHTHRIKLGLLPCSILGGRLTVKKGYSLATLKLVTAVINSGAAQVFAIGLTFSSSGRDTEITFQAKDEETLFKLLCPLWYFVTKYRQPDSKPPDLVGLPERRGDIVNHITDWNARYLDQSIERRLTSRQCGGHEDQNGNGNISAGEEEEGEDEDDKKSRLFISAKEEKDLQQLLTRYDYEVSDIADFQERLQQELAALEADNVQTILNTTVKVAAVRDSLNDALALLDDVNENLETFDTKLQFMREDIGAIENRNNRLELQTRNNGKLLTALDRLLDKLQLSTETERRLRQGSFGTRNLEAMIEAGWELYDHLHSLGESVKDSKTMAGFGNYGIANMKAVAEERARFATLTTTYVHQAAGYIGMELMNKTTVHLQLQLGKRGANQRQHVPDHESLHTEVDDLTSLVYVARTMHPSIITKISMRYTEAFNGLLKKEFKIYTSDMRKSVLASIANLPSDVSWLKGHTRATFRKETQPDSSFTEKQASAKLSPPISPSGSPKKGTGSPRRGVKEMEIGSKMAAAFKMSEAWSQLLQDWIPLLLGELDFCAEFLKFKEDEFQYTQDLQSTIDDMDHLRDKANEGNEDEVGMCGGHLRKTPLENARLSAIGVSAIDALVADLDTDFFTIVDIVASHQQLQAIPMLATTLKWQAKIKSLPLAAPLYIILHQCAHRLLGSFKHCIMEMEQMLHKFESRYHHKDGLKHIHILPFVECFPQLVTYIEELMQSVVAFKPSLVTKHSKNSENEEEGENGYDESAEDEYLAVEEEDLFPSSSMMLDTNSSLQGSAFGKGITGTRTLQGKPLQRASLRARSMSLAGPSKNPFQRPSASRGLAVGRPILDVEGEANLAVKDPEAKLRQLSAAELPEEIPELRLVQTVKDAVDPAFAILSRAAFAAVEAIGNRDAKHGERVKMESYLAFSDNMRRSSEINSILDYFVRDANKHGSDAIENYIQQQMEYAKVWRLVEFSQGVDEMLQQVGQEEVTFQKGFLPSDFQHLLSATVNSSLQKRLISIKARIAKHMEGDLELLHMIWMRFQDTLKGGYGRLYNAAEALYPSIPPPLTPDDLDVMFASIDGISYAE